MLEIQYRRKGTRHQLTLSGHADYGKEDIVCSAASCLFYSLCAACSKEKGEISFKSESGDSYIICERSGKRDAFFDMAAEGFEALSKEYPQNVKFLKIVKDF